MLASRLQQAIIKRVDFIENLILIHSYSEILTVKVQQYHIENEQMYQKEMIMVETFRNIFRIDESFRKFFYRICLNVFTRLHPKFKRSNAKNITRIHNVYFEFLLFFKGINELAIAKYLCDLNFETLSENELFIKLTHILIKYIKIKTEAVIQKLSEKCTTSKSVINLQKQDRDISKLRLYENIERRQNVERKRFNNFLRKTSFTQSISKRKYSSEQACKKIVEPIRKISNQISFNSSMLSQNRDIHKDRGISNIDWKIRFKKFQDYYNDEWAELYRLTGLEEQMEQLKLKTKMADETSKKQWINFNYRSLIKQMLDRNQQTSHSLTFFKQCYHRTH